MCCNCYYCFLHYQTPPLLQPKLLFSAVSLAFCHQLLLSWNTQYWSFLFATCIIDLFSSADHPLTVWCKRRGVGSAVLVLQPPFGVQHVQYDNQSCHCVHPLINVTIADRMDHVAFGCRIHNSIPERKSKEMLHQRDSFVRECKSTILQLIYCIHNPHAYYVVLLLGIQILWNCDVGHLINIECGQL